ncbi:MAG: FHA domain-containing protein [Planctomycetes bacterium]|nr:FHA domain-containing protein [Planctomycetota bacterium]
MAGEKAAGKEAKPKGDEGKGTGSRRAYLTVLAGQEKALHIIEKDRVSLGTQEQNDVILEGDGISNFHAEIYRTDEGWQIKDLGSTNGTYVNRQRVVLHQLAGKDKIIIGKVLMRFSDKKPVPPRFLLYGGLGAVILAVLLWFQIRDLLRPAVPIPGTGAQGDAGLYNEMMNTGLVQYQEKDFDRAEGTFQRVKGRFKDRSAPNSMLQLTRLSKESPDLASFPWDKAKECLLGLQRDCPGTKEYQEFLKVELDLIDADIKCAPQLLPLLSKDTTDEEKFRLLQEAGEQYEKSRIYKVYRDQMVPLGLKLKSEYAGKARAAEEKGKQEIAAGDLDKSGESFLEAKNLYEKAQTFDVKRTDQELAKALKDANMNCEAYARFIEGRDFAKEGKIEEAKSAFGLVKFGSAYYQAAKQQVFNLQYSNKYDEIKQKYLGGEIDTAIDRARRMKTDIQGKDELKDLERILTQLERRMVRIQAAYPEMEKAWDEKRYKDCLDAAETILESEREDRAENFYVQKADERQRACRGAVKDQYEVLVRAMDEDFQNGRYIEFEGKAKQAEEILAVIDPRSEELREHVRGLLRPQAVDMTEKLKRLKFSGTTDTPEYQSLLRVNQLIIDYLAADPAFEKAVKQAKTNLGQR